MGLFSKLRKNKSDDFNLFLQWSGIRGESEFYHQPEEYQMRANPENKITLGTLLNKTFDVRKEELSEMYVSDYQYGVGEMIRGDDIWNYDLCSHLIEHTEKGYSYKGGRVVLIVAYKMDKDIDRSLNRRYGTIIIHLGRQQGGSMDGEKISSFYICATVCMSPMGMVKDMHSVWDYEKFQPKALSVTFAFDTRSSGQKRAEYDYLHEQTLEKINRGKWDELTVKERYLAEAIIPNLGQDFYMGGYVLEEKRFWDAIIYFTKVYDALQEKWNKNEIADDERDVFFESCFRLGFCFCELGLYEKAFYYLDIVWHVDNIDYKMEYINCLVNRKSRIFVTIFILCCFPGCCLYL
jgi:tetratricopeptide (TPR) repeat protein